MAILVVFNSFNVVQNLKKLDPIARQMPPFNTTKVLPKIMQNCKILCHGPLLLNKTSSIGIC